MNFLTYKGISAAYVGMNTLTSADKTTGNIKDKNNH